MYNIVSTRQLSWAETAAITMGVLFLICFVRKRRAAWLISVLIYACVPLLNVSKNREFFTTASSQKAWEIRILALTLWLAWIGYLFYLRKVYYLFAQQEKR
jgi:hypothetical protein